MSFEKRLRILELVKGEYPVSEGILVHWWDLTKVPLGGRLVKFVYKRPEDAPEP
jgi:hypothetical protein